MARKIAQDRTNIAFLLGTMQAVEKYYKKYNKKLLAIVEALTK